jgi:hypothetical protein
LRAQIDTQVLRRLPRARARYRLPLFLPSVPELRPDPDGFTVFDGYDADSLDFVPGDGPAHNERRIGELGAGLNYLTCHPAQGGDELAAITETAHQRDFERQVYGGPAGRAALSGSGVETIGMRQLRELVRSN